MATDTAVPLIVDADWLKTKLDSNDTALRVLEAVKSDDAYEEHKRCHIPGAGFFNILHKVTNTPDFPVNMPSTEDFEEYARSLGVNQDSHVVIYDNSGQGGIYTGGRAWYLFTLFGLKNVSVLNNGMHTWLEKGYPTSSDVTPVKEGNFKAERQNHLYKTFDDMLTNTDSKHYNVVDSRPPHLYAGTDDDARSGHYPGAKSISFGTKLLDPETGCFKTREQLVQLFEESGVDLNQPTVAMCRTGSSACSLTMALMMCGVKDVGMYHGSFSQWGQKAPLDKIERFTHL